ncbi:MAG: VCBS domain-containing protein, partial [Acetobacteraceae bacterium]
DAQAVDALGAGAVGSDSFSVVVSDGQGGLATQPVSVTVNGANDAPVFVSAPVALTLTEGDSGASGQIDVSDAEGDGLSFAIDHGAGQYGTLQVDAFGAWSYVVDAGAMSGLAAGTVVTDLFTVSADDGNGGIATHTVSISVPVPSAPPSGPVFTSAPIDLVLADTSAADSFAAIAGVVAATGAVSFAIDPTQSGQGVFGLFAIDATGAWSYTPDGMAIDGLGENETGVDQFTILADDGTGGMVSQIVTVTVTGANDAPIIDSTSSVLVAPNSAFVTRITGTDAEGTWPLGVSIAGGPDASLFTLVDDQLFFNTVPDYATDPHVYMVDVALSDGLLTTVQTVTVTLQAPDGAPFTAIDPGSVPALAGQITAAILGGMSGITVDAGSLTAVAGPESMMFYDGSLTPLGIGAGLLLTSGGMPGTSNTVGYFGYDNAMPGDPALDAVVNTVFNTLSYDATSLTFDFTVTDPTVTGVSMNVVFGSDEFPEWVDAFVDIGVVLMNGVNVAYFNNDPMAPLSVIGSNLSARYFIDNTGNLTTSSFDGVAVPGVPSTLPIEYDGVSPMMKIFAPVHQGLNTLQIGIADTGDHIYDSGLFISNLTATDTPTSGVVIDVPCTDGDDDLAGSDASESFDGKAGNDIIDAGGGNDIVKGGDGDDDLSGADGDDFLDGGSGTNTLHGDAGDDRIQHVSGAGLDDIDGGTGRNTLIFAGAASTTAEVIDLSDPFVAQTLSDGSSFVNIAALVFHGGSGDDIVTGGAEADQLDGGLGDDVLSGGAGNDTIAGGDGTDTAVYGGDVGDYQVDTIGADLYRVTDLRGGAPDGVDTLSGIEQMQFLHGTFALSDLLTAGVTIQGTADDDVIEPGSTVAGQPMPTNQGDVIHGNGGDDHIQGGSGADTIWGDDGNDFLNGGDGNDVIMGGTGNDELRGDGGADRFVFASAADSPVNNVDVILDFHHAEGDLIDLSQIGAFSIVSAFTGSAGQLTIARSGDGYIVSGDTTGAGVASFAIQVDTQAMLTAANFQF